MDCWGDVATPQQHLARSHRDPARRSCPGRPSAAATSSSPTTTASSRAASRRPCASRSASCPRARSCSGSPTSSCSTTRSPARARTTPPSAPRSYLEQHPRSAATGRSTARWMQGDLRALLGLRAVRRRLDERAAHAAAAARAGRCSAPPASTRRSRDRFVNGLRRPARLLPLVHGPDERRALPRQRCRPPKRRSTPPGAIAVVGAGQSGAPARARAARRRVTRSRSSPTARAEEVAAGPVLSSQCMFDERARRPSGRSSSTCWPDACPPVEGISLAVADGAGGKAGASGRRGSTRPRSRSTSG